jgi:outer membrane protein TolC
MKKTLLTIILFAVAVQADELSNYLTEAAQNNPGLEAAFNQWKAALEKVPQIKALPDPRFSYSYFIEQVETRVGPQRQRVGISQVFPMFGKLKLRGGMAMDAAEAERQKYEQAKLNLLPRQIRLF